MLEFLGRGELALDKAPRGDGLCVVLGEDGARASSTQPAFSITASSLSLVSASEGSMVKEVTVSAPSKFDQPKNSPEPVPAMAIK